MIKNLVICSILSLYISNVNAQQKSNEISKWVAGIGVGDIFIKGDVRAIKTQIGQSLFLYKPIKKWFGVKLDYTRGNAKGLNYKSSENFGKNTALNDKYSFPYRLPTGPLTSGYFSNNTFITTPKTDNVYYNYKTSINSFNIAAVFTIPIPISKNLLGIHFNRGIGFLFYKAKINALNSNGTNYAALYKDVFNSPTFNKKENLKKLKSGLDDTYETNAEGGKQSIFTQNVAIGVSYKFKQKFEIGIERRYIYLKSDLLDGQRWQEYAYGDAVLTNDIDGILSNYITFAYHF